MPCVYCSTQTGVVMACGDIVHMSIVVFVGYFGRHGHKPRIMCVMAAFSAVGFALMTLPHWLHNDYSSHAATTTTGTPALSLQTHVGLVAVQSTSYDLLLATFCRLSVCLSCEVVVITLSPTKTDESIEVLFGCGFGRDQGTVFQMGSLMPHGKWQFWGSAS